MKLLVGLGNPGKEYERTRHNVGFRVLDALGVDFSFEKKFNAEVARDDDVLYCKPMTFMNNSGQAVRAIVDYFNIDPGDVVVVYDDKDLPFGTVRLRSVGSAGGHNGMRSIIGNLGTNSFARVRIGVAPEHPIADTAKYVLGRFSADEEEHLADVLHVCQTAIADIVTNGIDNTTHRDINALN